MRIVDVDEVMNEISKIGVVSVGGVLGCLNSAKNISCKQCVNYKLINEKYLCLHFFRETNEFDFCSKFNRIKNNEQVD